MKIKEIYVEAGFTKSLPNYQNYKPVAGILATVEDGENEKQVFKKLWDEVHNQIAEQLKAFDEKDKSGVKKGL